MKIVPRLIGVAVSMAVLIGVGIGPASAYPAIPSVLYSGFGKPSQWTWTSAGTGARWDPTLARYTSHRAGHTIAWYYAPFHGATVSAATIRAAIRPIHLATGFNFVQVDSPGKADVIITWTASLGTARNPHLAVTHPYTIHYTNDVHNTIVEARMYLSRHYNLRNKRYWRTTIEHEFGHVMGLGHTGARAEIMYPQIGARTATRLGRGDVNGLHHVSIWQGAVK